MPPMEDEPEMPPMGDEPAEEDPFDKEPFDAGVEASEENEPKKFIQQLSGKLGQSLRKYTQDVGMDLELEKFAINSLLSASHTGEMDPEDQNDIIKRVENSGEEPDEDNEEMEMDDTPMEEPAMQGASNPAPAPEGGGPMGESFETLPKEHKQVFKNTKLGVNENDEYMSIEDLERMEREIEHNYTQNTVMGEDNEEDSLAINNKKDSFVDDSINNMIQDYLNTAGGFESPQTAPQTKPETKPTPTKVPRRSRPFRVRPNINPAPKGKNS